MMRPLARSPWKLHRSVASAPSIPAPPTMQPSSHAPRALAACAAAIALAACADDPIQPPGKSLPPASAPRFSVAADASPSDLGTLGGSDSRAPAINDSGHVVGF